MLFGILVVYSGNYYHVSLNEFSIILKLTGRVHKIIVVFNNLDLVKQCDTKLVKGVSFESVTGSNQFHEFSGWNEGLQFVKHQYPTQYQNSHYVFCNDTFCQHRTYTFFHRLIFSASCTLSFVARKPTMAGEVNSFGKEFEFNHSTFNNWVSSYFFSMNQPAINLIKFDILPSSDVVNKYLVGGNNEKYFFANSMDLTLKEHLLDWLFHGGWYKSERLNQDNQYMHYYKARSIIAEFNLSAKAHANNIIFLDVYFLIKLFNKIKFKLNKLCVKFF